MSNRIIHDTDYMKFIMTPPLRSEPEYENYQPIVSNMRIVSDRGSGHNCGLGQLPVVSNGESSNSWVMPVVVIVVSAMALMTLYAILSKR